MGLSHAVSLPCAKNIILFLCLSSLSFNIDEIETPYKNIYLENLSYKLHGISLRSIYISKTLIILPYVIKIKLFNEIYIK